MFDVWMCLNFIVVGILWGATNPFIQHGSKSTTVDPQKSSNNFLNIFKDLINLFLNWRFFVPFLVNQCGSFAFYALLGAYDMSLTVPIVNSLTLLFTFLSEAIFFKRTPDVKSTIGCLLIATGSAICLSSSVETQSMKGDTPL